jgi:hypothetical protein
MFFHKSVCAKKKKNGHFGGSILESVVTNKANSFSAGAYLNGLTTRQFKDYSDFVIGQQSSMLVLLFSSDYTPQNYEAPTNKKNMALN